eukprot:1093457-Karenia_brevis.AAC.1
MVSRLVAPVAILSVDIVNGDRGDLTNSSHLAFWVALMAQDFVVGASGGPPCETWSAARGRSL